MSEFKLFRISGQKIAEIASKTVGLEKSLQSIIESNLETVLGAKFVRTEYSTGKSHAGRIDTLGIDENGCPVIIEYKRAQNENVINQGLFYLDWLLDHKAEFKNLVMEKLGAKEANRIDWTSPRLVCISADFNKYDEHAVKQIGRNIDLVRYRRFGNDLLALELVHSTSANEAGAGDKPDKSKPAKASGDSEASRWLAKKPWPMRDLYEALRSNLMAQGDDVQEKQLKVYVAYRRIKNFACVVMQNKRLLVYLELDPSTVPEEKDFINDVSKVGHWGTGKVEIILKNMDQLRKVEPLLARAYQET